MSDILTQVQGLSHLWHQAGSVPDSVLAELDARFRRRPWRRSLETGCGRTTLLLSNLSEKHTVFAFDGNDTSEKVFGSELYRKDRVEFVPGPTQRTVPAYPFGEPYQLILLDGPHSYPFPELEYYYVYPHLEAGGTLVIDDIWIPTIHRMFEFLREDPMYRLDKVVVNTAFFVRTDAPAFDPYGDNWPAQPFNRRRFPMNQPPLRAAKLALKRRAKKWLHALGLRKEY